uniref:Uncharacterized protein n=1 Tax=Strigamia maritima TaxID=126957 RepID=T1IYA7_STRMM
MMMSTSSGNPPQLMAALTNKPKVLVAPIPVSVVMNGGNGSVDSYRSDIRQNNDKEMGDMLSTRSSSHPIQAPVIVQAPSSGFASYQAPSTTYGSFVVPAVHVNDQVSPMTSSAACALNMLASSAAAKRSYEAASEDSLESGGESNYSPKRCKPEDGPTEDSSETEK